MTVTTQSQRRGDLFGSRSFTKDDLLAVPEFKEALDDYAEYVRRYQWDVMTAVRKMEAPELPDLEAINTKYRAALLERWDKMFRIAQARIDE